MHHIGDIRLYHPSRADADFDYNLAVATSAPGSYLNWHRHPAGQQLIVTEGEGYYQQRGQAPLLMRKGDVIKCKPGVEHWHGATPERGVTYLAISGNQRTRWGEELTAKAYAAVAAARPQGYTEQYLLDLSKKKWQWMADKHVDTLDHLFHEQAMFIHMGGNMSKTQELDVIRTGRIHYKQVDVHEASVEVMGNTAVLLNRITLLAVAGDREVTNPFTATEIYLRQPNGEWQLGSLAFSKLLER